MSAPTNIVGAAVAAAAAWTIVSHDGPIELLVFDIGANVPCSVLEDTAHKHFKIWEKACFGGFLNGREIAKRLVARGRGTLIFTGATKARRNAANFAAFSGAKPALRAHAQSMARDLEPQGDSRRARRRRRCDRHRIQSLELSRTRCIEACRTAS